MAEIIDFILEMREYELELLNSNTNNKCFSQIGLISEVTDDFQKDYLYIGSWSQISQRPVLPQNGMFLLINDTGPVPEPFIKANTVILSRLAPNHDILFFKARQWLNEYSEYLEASNHLLKTYLKHTEDTLKQLINQAAVLLRNPVVILDANCKILASSEAYMVEDVFWLQNMVKGYCAYEQIIELQSFMDSHPKALGGEPFIITSSFSANRLFVSKLQTEEENMGIQIVFETTTPFSKMNRKLFSLIAGLTTVVIHGNYEKNRTLNEYSEDNILIECLSGELKSYAGYQERIRNSPFQEPSLYRVILIEVEHFENFDPRKVILRTYFSGLFRRSWMLWYRGNVVSIVDVKDAVDIQSVLEKGSSFFQEKSLRFGISDVFENIYNIEQYYHQGLSALWLSTRLKPQQMFAYYNDYKFYEMARLVLTQPNPHQYLNQKLIEIWEYDRKYNTEYYHTLREYLFSGQNLSKTAKALHVHKNTVSYRINKAKTLFSIHFDCVEEIFCLMYSFYMKDLMDIQPDETKDSLHMSHYPFNMLC